MSSYHNGRPKWPIVTPADPCPECGRGDQCKRALDRQIGYCFRNRRTWKARATDDARGINGHGTGYVGRATRHRPSPTTGTTPPGPDWAAEAERLRGQLTPDLLAELAATTGLPVAAWAALSPGWAAAADLRRLRANGRGWADDYPAGAYAILERSGDGRPVGLSLRASDGRKGSPGGAGRGLVFPPDLHQRPDPVLIVEGASDVAACVALNLAAVGRPSNTAGADDLAHLLDGRAVLVVGENDGKPTGAWPGRDGAKSVAAKLAGRWGDAVRWTLPPPGVKDVRDYARTKLAAPAPAPLPTAVDAPVNAVPDADPITTVVDSTTVAAAAGAELLTVLTNAAKAAKPEKRSQADMLVDLARELYRLGVSDDGEAFAVPLDGPTVAVLFRGGTRGLRSALAKRFRQQTGRTPSASALADARTALEGLAADARPETVALRVAELPANGDANAGGGTVGGVVLDLGDASGRAAVVTADGWAVRAVSPVLFRRTVLTGPLPEPEPADPSVLAELRSVLNVDANAWPLVVGYLVAMVIPSLPHPILLLGGEQGTGKSTAARFIMGLVDPSTAQLRSEPKDAEAWAVAASGSWTVCLDNVSGVSGWLSDALCKAVTGDGMVRRKLYTDSDLAVLAFRRCVAMTSIDAGALRGDLGDRLLVVDLERIDEARRRTESDVMAAYAALQPRLLGALLSVVARTLAALPSVKLASLPRMADFARVLAALDAACPELTGGRALQLFVDQRRRIADDVVESDAVAVAVVRLMENREDWSGTAGELLAALTPTPAAQGLAGQCPRAGRSAQATASGAGGGRYRSRAAARDRQGQVPPDREAGEPTARTARIVPNRRHQPAGRHSGRAVGGRYGTGDHATAQRPPWRNRRWQ